MIDHTLPMLRSCCIVESLVAKTNTLLTKVFLAPISPFVVSNCFEMVEVNSQQAITHPRQGYFGQEGMAWPWPRGDHDMASTTEALHCACHFPMFPLLVMVCRRRPGALEPTSHPCSSLAPCSLLGCVDIDVTPEHRCAHDSLLEASTVYVHPLAL